MQITNNHKSDLGLPNGQVLRSKEPTEVRDWAQMQQSAVVMAWVKAGILSVSGTSQVIPPEQAAATVSADKDVLIARLAELDVKADKRKSVEKLQAMLTEAQQVDESNRKAAIAAGRED